MEHKTNRVVLFSKDTCKYCTLAKEFLSEKGVPFSVETLEPTSPNYKEERQTLIERSEGHTTFPWVFVGDTFIGGYSDLVRAYDTMYLEMLGIEVGDFRNDF